MFKYLILCPHCTVHGELVAAAAPIALSVLDTVDTLFTSLSSFEVWIKGTKTGVSELAKLI